MDITPKIGDIVWTGIVDRKDEKQRTVFKTAPAIVIAVHEPFDPERGLSAMVFSSEGNSVRTLRYSEILSDESWLRPPG
jgi:hypothetical protein